MMTNPNFHRIQTCQFWPHQVSIDRNTAPVNEGALGLQIAAYRCVRGLALLLGAQWVSRLAASLYFPHKLWGRRNDKDVAKQLETTRVTSASMG